MHRLLLLLLPLTTTTALTQLVTLQPDLYVDVYSTDSSTTPLTTTDIEWMQFRVEQCLGWTLQNALQQKYEPYQTYTPVMSDVVEVTELSAHRFRYEPGTSLPQVGYGFVIRGTVIFQGNSPPVSHTTSAVMSILEDKLPRPRHLGEKYAAVNILVSTDAPTFAPTRSPALPATPEPTSSPVTEAPTTAPTGSPVTPPPTSSPETSPLTSPVTSPVYSAPAHTSPTDYSPTAPTDDGGTTTPEPSSDEPTSPTGTRPTVFVPIVNQPGNPLSSDEGSDRTAIVAVTTSCAAVLGLALAALFLRNRREKIDSGAADNRCVKREPMPDEENTILHEIMILDKGETANGYVDIDPKRSLTTDTPTTLVNHPKMFDDTVAMCSTGFCGPSPKTDSELLLYDTEPNYHDADGGAANPNNSLTECDNDATTPRNRSNNSSSRPSHNAPLVRMSPRHRSSPRTPGSGSGRLPPLSPSLGARPLETNEEEDYFTAGSSSSSNNNNNNTGSQVKQQTQLTQQSQPSPRIGSSGKRSSRRSSNVNEEEEGGVVETCSGFLPMCS